MESDELAGAEPELDAVETERLAKRWAVWTAFDLKHFIEPLCAATGLTKSELLLYLMSERLGQIADVGVTVRLFAHHEFKPPPNDDPGEEWKK